MDELINLLVQKTGMSEEQAREVADVVVEFLKSKLPEPFRSQVENLISGAETEGLGGVVQGITGMLGGLFGKKE
jgi:hypothetical protein